MHIQKKFFIGLIFYVYDNPIPGLIISCLTIPIKYQELNDGCIVKR